MRLAQLLRQVDPIRWPSWFAWVVVGLSVIGPFALIFLDVPTPPWLIFPTWGLVWWRLEGRRYRDIASWVVPLGAIQLLGSQLDPKELAIGIELLAVVVVAFMLIDDSVKKRWLALVAPGYYRAMRANDQRACDDLTGLYRRFLRTYDRLYRTADLARFQRDLAKLAAKTSALKTPDAEWERVRRLLVYLLEWYAARAEASDEEWDEAHRRRGEFVDELQAISAERSYPIGSRSSA